MTRRSGSSHTIVKPSYALLAPDSRHPNTLPGWRGCTVHVLVSAALGAGFSQYLMTFDADGRGEGETDRSVWFFYVVTGDMTINGVRLAAGGFACAAPGERYLVDGPTTGATLLVFRLSHAPAAAPATSAFSTGHEERVAEQPFLGESCVRAKPLFVDPSTPAFDISILSCCPGGTLPAAARGESGLLFLTGGGVYRLGDDWHPVIAGDALWISRECPQWFIAAGPQPARWICCRHTA